MTVALIEPVLAARADRNRMCVSCERVLASMISCFEDGTVFPLCQGCHVEDPSSTVIPIAYMKGW